jgi:hypothetical protein
LTLLVPGAGAAGSGDYPYSGSGTWTISHDTRLTAETVMVNGDLIIESGARLTLIDSKVLINCSSPNQYRVLVRSGGSLEMASSSIEPVNGSNGFRLTVEKQAAPAPVLSPDVAFIIGSMVGLGVGFPLGIGTTAYAYKRWFSRNLPPPV